MASRLIACGDLMVLKTVIEVGGGEWRKDVPLWELRFTGSPVVINSNLSHDEIVVGCKRRRPYTYDDIIELLRSHV